MAFPLRIFFLFFFEGRIRSPRGLEDIRNPSFAQAPRENASLPPARSSPSSPPQFFKVVRSHSTTSFFKRQLDLQFLIFRNIFYLENFQECLQNDVVKTARERFQHYWVDRLAEIHQFGCKAVAKEQQNRLNSAPRIRGCFLINVCRIDSDTLQVIELLITGRSGS